MHITFAKLDHTNFSACSLDDFVRHQQVSECWRNEEGTWKLAPISFVEDWSLEQCRKIASDVVAHMEKDQTAFGAFDGERLVGFITLSHNFFGHTAKYAELVCFQVSEPYRGKGIGKILFGLACEEAMHLGAEKLYISGHSSKESQAAYKALGCVHAKEINQKLAEEEPFDVQLEYALDRTYTKRLILRRFREEDLRDLHEYLSDAETVRFEPYKPMTLHETAENLAWRISTDEMIAVELKESGKMIGNVYLGKRDSNSLELGFVFNRQYWGQGYAAESCEAALEQALSGGIHRIYAECDPENVHSWHLLERLGFKREGHLRQNIYFWTDEQGQPVWKDTFLYGMLREDRRERRVCTGKEETGCTT